jgi:hypothetical protein
VAYWTPLWLFFNVLCFLSKSVNKLDITLEASTI